MKPGQDTAESIANIAPDIIILDFDDHAIANKGLKHIRKSTSAILVTLSYFADEKSTVQALEQGANDHIIKPIRPMEFVARPAFAIKHKTAGI